MKDLELKNQTTIELVYKEHRCQIAKWGVQDHHPYEWLAFATEELGELSQAISDWWFRAEGTRPIVKEAIQVATLCLKIAEMFIEEERAKEYDKTECIDTTE